MNYLDNYNLWKTNPFFDEETRQELSSLNEEKDKKEIEDRFYQDLEFGTAGLRGIMGAGTNRMNKYTVAKATMGFAKFLLEYYGEKICAKKGVVVARDTRNNSEFFASITADVFSAMGIKVYFLKNPSPIPVLSYSIRKLKAIGGVVITASHNPREYNGYKAYDETGCQLVPSVAEQVTKYFQSITDYTIINFQRNPKFVKEIDTTDKFVSVIAKQSRVKDKLIKSDLKIVYSPLHGSGYIPVCKALKKVGFNNVYLVERQTEPDGNFPTVSAPNPETADALNLGIIKAQEVDADIVLGTDPDADRVGVAVKTREGYKLLTGNQTGVLLVKFLTENIDTKKFKRPAIVKSIVTSELGAEIAQKSGVKMFSTLTGFKFIGERITQFEIAKKARNESQNYNFLMGYEESYGYLIGEHARDKDSVVSCMLISEMSAKLKAEGKTLIDKLNEIYSEFGYYIDTQESFTLKGKDGLEKIKSLMSELRKEGSPFENTKKVLDYTKGLPAEEGFGNHPKADVLQYVFNDGAWVAVRPSGTEPKIKLYYSIKGSDENETTLRLEKLKKVLKEKLGL